MPRPVHFEIHAEDPERAVRFYEDVFGWTFSRWGDQPYWLVTTGKPDEPGIDGGLLPRKGPPPEENAAVNAFCVTVEVPDVSSYVDAVAAAGGVVAVPTTPVPKVGWLAYVKDTEGNILGLMQSDPDAS